MTSRLLARIGASLSIALVASALAVGPATASSTGVVISEFRFRGPVGGNDEFVELLNTSSGPVDISGWQLQGCAGSTGAASTRTTVPSGISLAAGQHYLFTNSSTSGGPYSGSVSGDRTYSIGFSDDGGARIVTAAGTVVDGVANQDGSADVCREGTGVALPTTNGDNSFERKAGGTQDTDDNATDFAGPQTGQPQNSSGGGGGEPPPPSIIRIHDIQGPGSSSPLSDQKVTIEGVVTGWDDEIGANFERTFPEDAGIFVQEEPGDVDNSASTSEGIFVGFVRDRQAYPLGSVVRLEGQVKEKFGLTMIAETFDTEPVITGSAVTPEPVAIDVAAAESQSESTKPYYETLESMRVRLAEGTANSGGTNKFGEVFMTPGSEQDRVFRTESEPALIATDADAGAGDPDNPFDDPDGSSTEVDADLFDRVENAVGPLAYSFSHFKVMVQPNLLPTVVDGPTQYPYSEVEPTERYELRIASFNVENFLPVGAELDLSTVSQEEYDAKHNRIVDAIDRLLQRPDVVAVQEVGELESLREVAARLGGYTAYLEEGNDSRGIDVGFLIKSTVSAENVRQLGKDAPGTCSDVAGRLFDRPPLAADITANDTTFTIFSNHFSSKSAPDSCREAQAAFVRDRVREIEASGGDAVVAGDLNAFEDEGALLILQDGTTSLTNMWGRAPEQERYSFAFSGKLQTLDHVLVTDGLEPTFEDFMYAHFDNDYFERNDSTDGHKVSDHDPPLLTLDVDACRDGDDRPTVFVRTENSGVQNRDTGNGCTINDLIREEDYPRHEDLVRHVEQVTSDLEAAGIISKKERKDIVKAARRAR